MSFVVDSHAHVIAANRSDYPTRPLDAEVAARSFDAPNTAERLLVGMDETGVDLALLVQRSQIYGFDNSYVCDAALERPDRFRAVIAIDASEPGCVLAARGWIARGAAGLRLMGPPRPGPLDWLAGVEAEPLWRFAADTGTPMCVHLFPFNRRDGLTALAAVLDRFGPAPVVIDHLSNAPISEGVEDIDASLALFAERPNVSLKLTAIPLARLREQGISAAAVLRRFIAAFGADRLMWGSDVAQSPGSYAEIVELGTDATRDLAPAERDWIMGGTAARVYRLAAFAEAASPQ